jgi:hypothetical protein
MQRTQENNGELEVVSIKMSEIKSSFDTFIMVEISDLSDVQTRGLSRLQKLFQRMLTNALSHERMTPLNSIVNVTENVRKYCQRKQNKQPIYDSVVLAYQELDGKKK